MRKIKGVKRPDTPYGRWEFGSLTVDNNFDLGTLEMGIDYELPFNGGTIDQTALEFLTLPQVKALRDHLTDLIRSYNANR